MAGPRAEVVVEPAADRARSFPVVEIFGPVIQGEGEMIGRQTHFVRFGGCDYRCSWCDSPQAVIPSQIRAGAKMMTTEQIVNGLHDLDYNVSHTQWVTLSGGNPGLFDLTDLVDMLHHTGYRVAVETQGSRYQKWFRQVECLTVSPKGPSSGMAMTDLLWDELTKVLACSVRSNLKVVVLTDEDFEFATKVHRMFYDRPMTVQPCNIVGTDDTGTLLEKWRWLADKTMGNLMMSSVRVLPQLHVLAFGNERLK